MKHLIDIFDLNTKTIENLISTAIDIYNNPEKYTNKCKGKKLAALFYEPSTRTRLSFEAAMLELGGNVIGFSGSNNSSVAKGESLSDTIKVVNCFADIIALRHPQEGAAKLASMNSIIPIINAGDGGHLHPTQTLADLYTIYKEKGSFNNLTIGFCGDLKYGRTVHSLLCALSRYNNVKMIFISPQSLRLPDYFKKEILEKNKISYLEVNNIKEVIENLDILYMTRMQLERFQQNENIINSNNYILTPEFMKFIKKNTLILHPLPRVDEIHPDIDNDNRACYFKQVLNGKYIRMALLLKLLENNDTKQEIKQDIHLANCNCKNKNCISNHENFVKPYYKIENNKHICIYCDTEF